ncbi:MAG: hypothetical protein MUE77_07020 [Sandarakinorhabdus sp.]|jgi:hypothetical protein|nr:hypothetical protein [Sandarakinorhabdus sp.]
MMDKQSKRKPPMLPGPGRPKGVPNKLTREVKAILQEAFEELGGVEKLVAWASRNDRNYGEFLRLWVRLLPIQIGNDYGDVAAIRIEMLEAAKRQADERCAQQLRAANRRD